MKKIQTYKIPFKKRFAHNYEFYKYLTIFLITIIISLTILLKNKELTIFDIMLTSGSIAFLVLAIIKLIAHIKASSSFYIWKNKEAQTSEHVTINSGAPGTGKTLYETMKCYYMAKHSWQEVQYEYWLICSKLRDSYQPTEDEREIIEAYNFYINNPGIPCLSSNYPIYSEEYERFSYIIDASHLKQEERVPYRNVSAIDEIGTICNLELCKDRSNNYCGAADMSDEFRFCRQHAEWRINGTEQESTNVFKDVRRVVASVIKLKGVTKVLKPKFLTWIYNLLKSYFVKHMSNKESLIFSKFMLRFKNFLNNTGYLKLNYVYLTGTEDSSGNVSYSEKYRRNGKDFVVYFPCATPIKYNSRIFRSSYKAIDKSIKLAVFQKLNLTKQLASKMLKSETLKAVNQEKEALKLEEEKKKLQLKEDLKLENWKKRELEKSQFKKEQYEKKQREKQNVKME